MGNRERRDTAGVEEFEARPLSDPDRPQIVRVGAGHKQAGDEFPSLSIFRSPGIAHHAWDDPDIGGVFANRNAFHHPPVRQAVEPERGLSPVTDDQMFPVRRQAGSVRSHAGCELAEDQSRLRVDHNDPVPQHVQGVEQTPIAVQQHITYQRVAPTAARADQRELARVAQRAIAEGELPDTPPDSAANVDPLSGWMDC